MFNKIKAVLVVSCLLVNLYGMGEQPPTGSAPEPISTALIGMSLATLCVKKYRGE